MFNDFNDKSTILLDNENPGFVSYCFQLTENGMDSPFPICLSFREDGSLSNVGWSTGDNDFHGVLNVSYYENGLIRERLYCDRMFGYSP